MPENRSKLAIDPFPANIADFNPHENPNSAATADLALKSVQERPRNHIIQATFEEFD
jgi:hypothetical protein